MTYERKTPYEQGQAAYAAGKSLLDSPYDWDTVEDYQWTRGWCWHLNRGDDEHA